MSTLKLELNVDLEEGEGFIDLNDVEYRIAFDLEKGYMNMQGKEPPEDDPTYGDYLIKEKLIPMVIDYISTAQIYKGKNDSFLEVWDILDVEKLKEGVEVTVMSADKEGKLNIAGNLSEQDMLRALAEVVEKMVAEGTIPEMPHEVGKKCLECDNEKCPAYGLIRTIRKGEEERNANGAK